jgi:hypothetical protein
MSTRSIVLLVVTVVVVATLALFIRADGTETLGEWFMRMHGR